MQECNKKRKEKRNHSKWVLSYLVLGLAAVSPNFISSQADGQLTDQPDPICPETTLITTHISHGDITAAVGATRHLELQDIGALNAAAESSHTSKSTSLASSTPTPTQTTNETNQYCSTQPQTEHIPQIRIYRIKPKSKSKNRTKAKPKSDTTNLYNIGLLLIIMPPNVRIHGWTRESLLVGEIPRLNGFGFRSEKELDYGLLSASEALGSVVSQLDAVIGIERLFSWR
jgi:hypothetical protein